MGAFNNDSDHQLSPEMAERKDEAERLGYIVRKNGEDKWVVRPPSGVVFIHLQPPGRKAFKHLTVADFNDSHDELMVFWESLPEEEKDYWSGCDRYYHVDPVLRARWEAFYNSSNLLTNLILDTSKTRELFEGEREDCELLEEDFSSWAWDKFRVMNFTVDNGSGRWFGEVGLIDDVDVFAVKFRGSFLDLSIDEAKIVTVPEIELSDYMTCYSEYEDPSVDELPSVESKELRLGILRAKRPDSFISFDDRPRGNAEVKWVIPGLVERGGLTLTFAKESFGKTALVMFELWRASQRHDCNVLYLAFENHNGLDARCEALEKHYGSAPSFIAEKASWDLGELDEWGDVAELVEEYQQVFLEDEHPLVVVFDTVGAAILEGSRVMGGVERFYGGLRRMVRRTGVSAWVIGHGNSEGDIFGFKGAKHDADVVTKITQRTNGRDYVHTRIKGRHASHGEQLCVFNINVLNGVPVAVCDVEGKDAPQTEVTDQYPELPESCLPLIPLLEDAGAVDGLTGEGLRGVLNSHFQVPGSKNDTLRQQRYRAKKALLGAEAIKEVDGLFYLVD